MSKRTLGEKFLHMLPYQLIVCFIDAMEFPIIEYDARTFGTRQNGKLKACAASNLICKQMGYIYEGGESSKRESRALVWGVTEEYLENLEMAIHSLSKGLIYEYNERAKPIGLAKLKFKDFPGILPALENGFTSYDLDVFRRFALFQI